MSRQQSTQRLLWHRAEKTNTKTYLRSIHPKRNKTEKYTNKIKNLRNLAFTFLAPQEVARVCSRVCEAWRQCTPRWDRLVLEADAFLQALSHVDLCQLRTVVLTGRRLDPALMNLVSGGTPMSVARIGFPPSLTSLICATVDSDWPPPSIRGLTASKLERLELEWMDPAEIPLFDQMLYLRDLTLHGGRVDYHLPELSLLTRLTALRLKHCSVPEKDVHVLSNLSALRELELHVFAITRLHPFVELGQALTCLTLLSLHSEVKIALDVGPIAALFPYLTRCRFYAPEVRIGPCKLAFSHGRSTRPYV